jgi:uncharacterized protein YjiS (DUF1127 family)
MTRHWIVQHALVALLRAIRALGTASAERIARVAKILRHRRDLEFLASLDERMLRDIGLTRSDLRFALSEPFWRDPGPVLISRVGQRGLGSKRRPVSVPSIVPTSRGWKRHAIGSSAVAPHRVA